MIDNIRSILLLIDFQVRLVPVIDDAEQVIAAAGRLREAARLLDVPVLWTEQYPAGLGHTIEALAPGSDDAPVIEKVVFGAADLPTLQNRLADDTALIVAGCETHVCVLQTVLGLRSQQRTVYVVADAAGSRRERDRRLGLERMAGHGAEIVTSEMVLFEWLRTAEHPARRAVLDLIR